MKSEISLTGIESVAAALPNVFSSADIQTLYEEFDGNWIATFYSAFFKGVLTSEAAGEVRPGGLYPYQYRSLDLYDDLDRCIPVDKLDYLYSELDEGFNQYLNEDYQNAAYLLGVSLHIWVSSAEDCYNDATVSEYLGYVDQVITEISPQPSSDYMLTGDIMVENINNEPAIQRDLRNAAIYWKAEGDPDISGKLYAQAIISSIYGIPELEG